MLIFVILIAMLIVLSIALTIGAQQLVKYKTTIIHISAIEYLAPVTTMLRQNKKIHYQKIYKPASRTEI